MSETLLAVIIGGAIAVVGSAVTQILLFWLTGRREKQEYLRRTYELWGRQDAKLAFITASENDRELDLTEIIEGKNISNTDDRTSYAVGVVSYFVEELDQPSVTFVDKPEEE